MGVRNSGGTVPKAVEEGPGGLRRRIHVEGERKTREQVHSHALIGTVSDAANRGGARGIGSRPRSRTDRAVATRSSSYTDHTSGLLLDTKRDVEGNGNSGGADANRLRQDLGRPVPTGGLAACAT